MIFGSYVPFHFENDMKISVSVYYLLNGNYTFNSNLTYGYLKGMRRSASNLFMVRWLLAELCPFYFENNMKCSVSVHYLPKKLTYGYVKGMCESSSNLIMVWWFSAELCPYHFENNMKFSVSIHYLPNGITHSTQI
jgi:hypothetical protein